MDYKSYGFLHCHNDNLEKNRSIWQWKNTHNTNNLWFGYLSFHITCLVYTWTMDGESGHILMRLLIYGVQTYKHLLTIDCVSLLERSARDATLLDVEWCNLISLCLRKQIFTNFTFGCPYARHQFGIWNHKLKIQLFD